MEGRSRAHSSRRCPRRIAIHIERAAEEAASFHSVMAASQTVNVSQPSLSHTHLFPSLPLKGSGIVCVCVWEQIEFLFCLRLKRSRSCATLPSPRVSGTVTCTTTPWPAWRTRTAPRRRMRDGKNSSCVPRRRLHSPRRQGRRNREMEKVSHPLSFSLSSSSSSSGSSRHFSSVTFFVTRGGWWAVSGTKQRGNDLTRADILIF